MWILKRSDINRAVQALKMARDEKFWIFKTEELYYLCSNNKDSEEMILESKPNRCTG